MAVSFIDTKVNVATGVSTASRIPPIDISYQRSHHREPLIDTPKMIIQTKYELEGLEESLLLLNIHAINFVSAQKLEHQLLATTEVIKEHQGPIVFAGDFNTWSKKRIRLLKSFFSSHQFTEISFSNGNQRTKVFGNIIDYIFVKGLRAHESTIYDHLNSSDHKALSVNLAVD